MNLNCAVLITNYNTWSLTERCVQALTTWSHDKLSQILIIDDASSESVPISLLNLSERIKIVYNQENKGYVASVNLGFLQLQEDIIILLDSDAYPLMDLVSTVCNLFANNPKLGSVGFQLVDEHGKPSGSHDKVPNAIEFLLGQTFSARVRSFLPIKNKPEICLYSCAIAVRGQAFQEISGFDEGFDFLDADIDFSMRLRKAGWQVQIAPELLAFHIGGGSPQSTAKRVMRFHKNRWRLLSKHQLLPLPKLLKIGLTVRHALEYMALKTCGSYLIKDPITLQDKLYSRRELLSQVGNNYGNE